MKSNIAIDGSLELKKHISAIHCSNNFTLVQRKLFNALLYNAYEDLQEKQQFEISARKLCVLIGYNSNDYVKLKQALMGLVQVVIEWNIIDHEQSRETLKWQASSAIASAKLEKGICTYEYSLLMKELLYHPEIYGRLDMNLIRKFSSNYGLALYENCIRFQNLPLTPWITVSAFRKLMGVSDDKYQKFQDFKKRVLIVAVNEVNKHAPISIDTELRYFGKNIEAIRFRLYKKDVCGKLEPPPHSAAEGLIEYIVTTFQLSKAIAAKMLDKYGVDYIKEKIAIVTCAPSYKNGKVLDIAAFFSSAVNGDYKDRKSSGAQIDEARVNADTLRVKAENEQKQRRELEIRYNGYCVEFIDSILESMNEDKKALLMNKFADYVKDGYSIAFSWYKKQGLKDGRVKAILVDYFKKEHSDKVAKLLTLEQFYRQNP